MNSRIQFSEVGTTTDGKQLFAVGVLPSNLHQHGTMSSGRCSACGHVRGDPRQNATHVTATPTTTRRPMSKIARKHISDAMKARHATAMAASTVDAVVAVTAKRAKPTKPAKPAAKRSK